MISTDIITNQEVSSLNLVTQMQFTICVLKNLQFLFLCFPISNSSSKLMNYYSLLNSWLHDPTAQKLHDTSYISIILLCRSGGTRDAACLIYLFQLTIHSKIIGQ